MLYRRPLITRRLNYTKISSKTVSEDASDSSTDWNFSLIKCFTIFWPHLIIWERANSHPGIIKYLIVSFWTKLIFFNAAVLIGNKLFVFFIWWWWIMTRMCNICRTITWYCCSSLCKCWVNIIFFWWNELWSTFLSIDKSCYSLFISAGKNIFSIFWVSNIA